MMQLDERQTNELKFLLTCLELSAHGLKKESPIHAKMILRRVEEFRKEVRIV